MKAAEAAALLTICAAYDNRKPDADQAKAWAMALDGYRFEDCRDAVVTHYRSSREWIMPSDVITAVKKVRGSRIEDAPPIPIPPGFDPDDWRAYQRLLADARRAQAEGREVVMPEYEPTRSIGELAGVLKALPPAEPKALDTRKTAKHDERLAEVRAELDAKRPAMTERVRALIPNAQMHEREDEGDE